MDRQRAATKSVSAARALVRHLHPLVAKLVRANPSKRAAQMIVIKVFQNLSRFSGAVPLEHWVSRIAINTCLNQIAAEKRAIMDGTSKRLQEIRTESSCACSKR